MQDSIAEMTDPFRDKTIWLAPFEMSEGPGYVAADLSLPGCTADGDTEEEALANLMNAILEWRDEAQSRFGICTVH